MKPFLMIDIGTSSLRVVLLDDSGTVIDSKTLKRPAPECFDAEEEWKHILDMSRTLTAGISRLSCVAISSLLGWVGIDANGAALTPCYSYMHNEPDYYQKFCDSNDVSVLYSICRRRVAPEQLAFKICRLQQEEPALYGKIKAFLSLKDFVNYKLTGISAIDHTTASYSLLYDVANRCWSSDCLQHMCLDDTRLPRLMNPWEQLGELTPEICRTLGLDAPCPVAVGSVDGSCGILGAGGTAADVLVSVMGTTDTCFLVSDKMIDDPTGSLVVNPHVIPGLYLAGGPMGMYGGALEWWLHHITNRTVSMAEMNEKAALLPPGACGVLAYPTLAGERTPFWNAGLTGTILGLRPEHRPEHVFRAMLEANCYATRQICVLLENGGGKISTVIASGGGSSSDLWLQIKANVLKRPICRSSVKESTLHGAFLLAQRACGIIPEKAEHSADTSDTFPVDWACAAEYNGLYAAHMSVHKALSSIYPLSSLAGSMPKKRYSLL